MIEEIKRRRWYQFSIFQLLVAIAGISLLLVLIQQFGAPNLLFYFLLTDTAVIFLIIKRISKDQVLPMFAGFVSVLVGPISLYSTVLLQVAVGFWAALVPLLIGSIFLVPMITVFSEIQNPAGGVNLAKTICLVCVLIVYRMAVSTCLLLLNDLW